MIEANNITVSYGERVALSHVSLTLAAGKITAVIGPNGAGKSTLLRTLNGGHPLSSGEILLNERPLGTFSRRHVAREIAVVAQEAEVRFPVNVLEFVLGGRYAWSGSTWGWETEADVRAAFAAIGETNLDELTHRYMNELSGGERQRAVLARALAAETPHLLLDEPTANLDLAHQAAIFSVVRQRCDRKGVAALIVTHDLNVAAEFSDLLLILKSGNLLAAGRPIEVLTPQIIEQAFAINALVDLHPVSAVPRITPIHQHRRT